MMDKLIATCSVCGLDFDETDINMTDYDLDLCTKCEKEYKEVNKMKKKYLVYGVITATTYIGEYEANSKEEAKEMAWNDASVSVCHQCSKNIEEPEIEKLVVEEIND